MELYKQTERESKTKAYSKEGLLITPKPDPREEEKEEMREMIKTLQSSFQDKINAKEIEVERIRNSKNKNNYNQEEILKQLRCLHFHFEKLELVLRSIENDYASLDQIWSLHDILDTYLRTEELADEQDVEQKYKDLNLPSKSLQHFPMLAEEDPDLQEVKPTVAVAVVNKTEAKPVEKGWNSKEALIKITGKIERVPEDLTDDEIEPVGNI